MKSKTPVTHIPTDDWFDGPLVNILGSFVGVQSMSIDIVSRNVRGTIQYDLLMGPGVGVEWALFVAGIAHKEDRYSPQVSTHSVVMLGGGVPDIELAFVFKDLAKKHAADDFALMPMGVFVLPWAAKELGLTAA